MQKGSGLQPGPDCPALRPSGLFLCQKFNNINPSTMSTVLGIDLNEIASREIAEKIESLESDLKEARRTINDQLAAIASLKKKEAGAKAITFLLDHLRNEFLSIERGQSDSGGYYDSKQKNQYLFMEKALMHVFGIKRETTRDTNGWYSSRSDGALAPYLAVNFYHNKDVVINLLQVLMPNCEKEISFIRTFQMPYDYPKEAVLRYVKAPKHNTNGCIFGMSEYWFNSGAGESNMPHDLIMKSPFITEDDVFKALLDTIKRKAGESHYLFALPKHNKSVSPEQIAAMGEQLLSLSEAVLGYEPVNNFIVENLKAFNSKTLDFLYGKIQLDNQFKTLHWEKFPNEYQMRFLKEKSLGEVLSVLSRQGCTWTEGQKKAFLNEFTSD
jgi:hypothetical protein